MYEVRCPIATQSGTVMGMAGCSTAWELGSGDLAPAERHRQLHGLPLAVGAITPTAHDATMRPPLSPDSLSAVSRLSQR